MIQLKQLKYKDSNPKYFIVFDSESFPNQTIIKKHLKQDKYIQYNEHILSFGYAFYYEKINNKYVRKDEILFTSKEQFTNYCLSHSKYKEKLYVFAHNIGYDYRLCISNDLIIKKGYKLKIAISENAFIYKFGKKDYEICFLSTTNYFKTSLKELGKTFNLKKLDFKFNDENNEQVKLRTKKALEYCYRDAEILEKVVLNLFNFIDFVKVKFCFTISSLSFSTFRTNFYKGNIVMHKQFDIEKYESFSYYGGRTECFKIGFFKNVYKLDINSMYSSQMIDNYFPVELISKLSYTGKNNKDMLLKLINEDKYLLIANVHINIDKRKIPYRDIDGKLLFPIGKFNTWLCHPELSLLSDNEILECKEILIYRKDKIFKDFVSYFYNLRLDYKNGNVEKNIKKDDVMQYFCKTWLNSNYGKFAQHNKKEKRLNDYDGLEQNGFVDLDDGNQFLKLKFINFECFQILNEGYGYNTFIPVSAFVTSYCRKYLYSLISLVENELIYVDTDSLFVTKKGYNILKDNGFVDKDLLGKLKLEGILNKLDIRNLKDYSDSEFIDNDMFQFRNDFINSSIKNKTEHKLKGIKKDAIEKALKNNENIGLKNEWNIKRILGFNESLRYFDLAIGDINETKNLKRTYEKGIVKDKIVYPFMLDE